jgi:hypothetical protein
MEFKNKEPVFGDGVFALTHGAMKTKGTILEHSAHLPDFIYIEGLPGYRLIDLLRWHTLLGGIAHGCC